MNPMIRGTIFALIACATLVHADEVEDARARRERARAKVTEEYLKIPNSNRDDLRALEKKYLAPAERDYAEALNSKAGASQKSIGKKKPGDQGASAPNKSTGDSVETPAFIGGYAIPDSGGASSGPVPSNRGLVLDGSGVASEIQFPGQTPLPLKKPTPKATSPSSKSRSRD